MGQTSAGRRLPCRGNPVVQSVRIDVWVRGGTDRDRRIVCAGSIRAAAFLVANGLTPSLQIRVEFRPMVLYDFTGGSEVGGYGRNGRRAVDSGPSGPARADPERIFGMYLRDRRLVVLTTEAASWLRSYTYFGLPMSEEMLTSMVAHEVTHALSKSLYAPEMQASGANTHVQDQYAAYVVQLATMTPELRDAVLANYPGHLHAFEEEGDINAWALGIGPEAFGVKSYRHFRQQRDGPGFLKRLFSGAFRPPEHLGYGY